MELRGGVVSGLKLSGCALPTNINKQHLIDARRQKYGKETTAVDESYLEAKSDAVLMTMWWADR
jgi:hypothetical protein